MSDKKITAYFPVSVEKELPKEDGLYYVTHDQKDIGTSYFDNEEFHLKTTHWLREFSLPELMEAFRKWYELSNYIPCDDKEGYYLDISNEDSPILINKEKMFNEFLKTQGML